MIKVFGQILIVLALLVSQNVYGVVARPTPIKYKLPDGSSLTIKLQGDEEYNWTSTLDGYRVVKNSDGYFVYLTSLKSGSVTPSSIVASEIEQRTEEELDFLKSVKKNIGVRDEQALVKHSKARLKSFTSNFPSKGSKKNLLILATFSDRTQTFTNLAFDSLMNHVNYKNKGSFRDFYLENSNGDFDITTTVTVWVTVPKSYAYYSPNTKWAEFAFDAIKAADPLVDYSQFEKNGSYLYGVTIIHQGMGQETSGNPNDIWSHQGELSYYKPTDFERTFDGVVLNSYSMQPEIYDPGKITGMGILTHEFGHLLGLPDYYDTDYEETEGNFEGTGSWDLMAFGAYNGSYNPATPTALDAASPAHNNPLSKEFLGWLTPITLNSAQQITLNPVVTDKLVYKIKTATSKEYFYIENRQNIGFDADLPGHGMLVYHVDSNWISTHSSKNDINNGSHQGLYVKAATGTSINTSGAPFPGAGSNMNITDDTAPNLNTWSGIPLNKSITNIVEDVNGVVTFDFMSIQNSTPRAFKATNYNSTTNVLNWLPSLSSTNVLIAFSTNPSFGAPVNGQAYSVGEPLPGGGDVIYSGSGNTFNHSSSVTPNLTYYYKIWTNSSLNYSLPLNTQVFTHSNISSFPWLDPIEATIDNWSSEWSSGPFLEWSPEYYDTDVTVVALYQFNSGNSSSILNSKPIVTEIGKDYRLSFKHIQRAYFDYQDSLTVLVKPVLSDTWIHLRTFKNNIPNWNYQDINLPRFTEPFQIGFKGNCDYGNGIMIDSIEIVEATPIETINYTISVMNEGTPISGAEVEFMGQTLYTNAAGNVLFSNIYPSRNWELLSVKANGFENGISKIKPLTQSTYQINLILSEAITPTNFTVSADYNDVTLNWNPVIDDSFEGYTPWDTTSVKVWTMFDFDKGTSGGFGSFNYPNEDTKSAFVAFDGSYGGINPNFIPHTGGQMAVCFYSNNKPNNDWMVSPAITISDGDYFEFYAKSADYEVGFESLRVIYSEVLNDTSSYLPLGVINEVPGIWTKYTYHLSALKGKKIYIGLHCFSNDKYALLIDDIKLKNSSVTDYSPKVSVSDGYTSNPESYGNIEYQILRDGVVVNTLSGFNNTSFVDNVSCNDFSYSLQTNYIDPARRSSSVTELPISTCRVVTINITESGNPVSGATVNLSGINQVTNSQGSVVFEHITDSNHLLTVTFTGYLSINETLNIVSDSVIKRAIAPITSISEEPFNNIKINPNPSNGRFVLTNDDLPIPFNYSVYTLEGSYMLSGVIDKFGESEIDLNLPSNGTYLLKLYLGNSVQTYKIMVFKYSD